VSAPLPGIVPDGDGARIAVQVVPRASRTEVVGAYGDEAVRLRLNAPPVDGKANQELVRFFAGALGVPARAVTLVSGQTGRRKTLRVAGVPPAAVQAALATAAR
jgi:hypothetical protein